MVAEGPAEKPDPVPGAVARALWAGALAGLVVGAGDALASWGWLGRFLPGAGDRLRCALFSGALYALVLGPLAALLTALVHGLLAGTALGPLLAHARDRHAAARQDDPRRALTGLALAIAAIPCFGGALIAAHTIGVHTVDRRQHTGLIVAVILAVTVVLCVLAVPATFVVGRLVEVPLRALPRRALRALGHPLAPPLVALALVALAAGAAGLAARPLLAQLALRPYFAALAWLAALLPAAALTGVALRGLSLRPPGLRAAAHALVVLAPLAVALGLGSDAVRKGAAAHTGLAAPFLALLPHGREGDLPPPRAARPPHDTAFVPVPASVPPDVNVLLLTVDTVRADHFGSYGYARATTPALDAVAARGAVFDNAWAHAPSTRYSMPAIITGRYPSHVLWDPAARTPASWWPGLKLENHTIGEVMKERGFATGAILNYEYFDARRRMDQGFDDYDNSNARLHSGSDPAVTRGSSSREQADAAIRWLDGHADRRFFLWVHFYDPHADYERHPGISFGADPMALYDGEIRFTDDQIARVLAELDRLGVAGKTAIIVTGDHGEGFGEHGIDHHGYDLYAPQTKVPLIIAVPGLPPRRVATPAGHVDLLPTLANLAGAPSEPSMSGRSLLGLVAGGDDTQDRAIYQEVSYEGPTEKRALATRRWHLLYNMVPARSFELYDLVADPAETHDLWSTSPEAPALAARLADLIDEAATSPDAGRAILGAAPRPTVAVGGDFGDAVRFLGADLPAEARRGTTVDVTWYFHAERPLPGRWRPFVHFEGPSYFQGDHDPPLPMARWQPGQYIADRQALVVPPNAPPGDYAVLLGIFEGGKRLGLSGAGAADAGENRLRVATLRVTP
jgi:arylsulfatase A-like enzyme